MWHKCLASRVEYKVLKWLHTFCCQGKNTPRTLRTEWTNNICIFTRKFLDRFSPREFFQIVKEIDLFAERPCLFLTVTRSNAEGKHKDMVVVFLFSRNDGSKFSFFSHSRKLTPMTHVGHSGFSSLATNFKHVLQWSWGADVHKFIFSHPKLLPFLYDLPFFLFLCKNKSWLSKPTKFADFSERESLCFHPYWPPNFCVSFLQLRCPSLWQANLALGLKWQKSVAELLAFRLNALLFVPKHTCHRTAQKKETALQFPQQCAAHSNEVLPVKVASRKRCLLTDKLKMEVFPLLQRTSPWMVHPRL